MRSPVTLLALLLLPLSAYSAIERSVAVSGNCIRSVSPDRASVVFTAEKIDKDPSQAAKRAREKYDAFRQQLKGIGFTEAELSTSEYSVEQVKDYINNRYVNTGNFKARMGLLVSTKDVSRLGQAIAAAGKVGMEDVGRMSLFISPERAKMERAGCLKEAAEDARKKAESLAASLGTRIGDVISVVEEGQPTMGRFDFSNNKMSAPMAAEAVSGNVEIGRQDLEVSVKATFALK